MYLRRKGDGGRKGYGFIADGGGGNLRDRHEIKRALGKGEERQRKKNGGEYTSLEKEQKVHFYF